MKKLICLVLLLFSLNVFSDSFIVSKQGNVEVWSNPGNYVFYMTDESEEMKEVDVSMNQYNATHAVIVITPRAEYLKDTLDCGTLSLSGVYTVKNNINSTGTYLTINASNVQLNGNGYYINHSRTGVGYGIVVSGQNNITISNISVVNTTTTPYVGIYAANTTELLIEISNISGIAGGHSIWFENVTAIVRNCYIWKFGTSGTGVRG